VALSLLRLVSLFGFFAAPAAGQSSAARALEESLVAPCCWKDTLATHDSPLVHELRAEIESRLAAGEPATAIESDLVERYGERIRTAPPELRGLPWIIAAASLLTISLIAWIAFRWKRGPKRTAAPDREPVRDAELDARIDAELDALDRS
jgi:cytochrome c-type biogenesis protein CcmH/NrfF